MQAVHQRLTSAEITEMKQQGLLNGAELCRTSQSIRDSLGSIIDLVDEVPSIGTEVAGLLRFLKELSDATCPGTRG